MPFAVREEAAAGDTRRPYDGYGHAFAGMSVQFALFARHRAGGRASCSSASAGCGSGCAARRCRARRCSLAKAISGTILTLMTLLVVLPLRAHRVRRARSRSLPGFFAVAIAMRDHGGHVRPAASPRIGRTPDATRRVAIFVVLSW